MSRTEVASQPPVLVVEDDDAIGHHLQRGLQGNGYATTWCRTGLAGLMHARDAQPSVILLDLGLPDVDGVDVARSLRAALPDALIVILTARSEEIDIIVGLDAGADDYLVKPFHLTVLLARLRAHLRRRPHEPESSMIQVGALTLDVASRRCLLAGQEIPLRSKELELLTALTVRLSVAVRREDLMNEVWDENWYGSTKTLDVTMASLRRKLSDAAIDQHLPSHRIPMITTLRGYGYRLELVASTT